MASLYKKLIELLLIWAIIVLATATRSATHGEPFSGHCPEHVHCGDVEIPYPFGTPENNCSLGPKFTIICNDSSDPERAILPGSNVFVTNISLGGELEISQQYVARDCLDPSGRPQARVQTKYQLRFQYFAISGARNMLTAIGCDADATLVGYNGSERHTTGCKSSCGSGAVDSFKYGSCRGVGCCQVPVPDGLSKFTVSLSSAPFKDSDLCSYAFVVEEGEFEFSRTSFRDIKDQTEQPPVVVDWSIGDVPCDVARKSDDFLCKNNSECVDSRTGNGYICQCLPGYQGNPYYRDGCEGSNSIGEPRNHNSKTKKTIIKVGAAVSALFIVTMILGILWRKGYWKQRISRETELRRLDLQTGFFTFRQIKTATNNFDPANKIGEGGFGPVYKGKLRDGTVIAVKQLSSKSKQGNREFVTEIGMISAFQHPNLVRLYGCCIEGNKLLLVYEYMENNSLARCLFEDDQLYLNWPMRQKICLGIAKGLAFLHEESVLKIVHRDIKATNVLLDKDLNAKISDFGLAKLDEEENTHISTRIAGTVGYMAPEYAQWGHLTFKADVYSFGVVALEIVSGKSNMKYSPSQTCVCLVDWALVLQREGNLMELVDTKFGSEFDKEEALRMLKVALLCLNQSAVLRPTMSKVVSMLEGADHAYNEPIKDPKSDGYGMRISAPKDQIHKIVEQSRDDESRSLVQSSNPSLCTASSSSSSKDLYPPNYCDIAPRAR